MSGCISWSVLSVVQPKTISEWVAKIQTLTDAYGEIITRMEDPGVILFTMLS